MKLDITIKEPIAALLKQLPPDTLTNGDAHRMRSLRLCLDVLRGELPEGLVANVFHDDASRALAEGITDAMRDILKASIGKRDGRRAPPDVASATAFKQRIKLLADALTVFNARAKAAHTATGATFDPERRAKAILFEREAVSRALVGLRAAPAPTDALAEQLEDMAQHDANMTRMVQNWINEKDDPAYTLHNSGLVLRWLDILRAMTRETTAHLLDLKNPG